MDVMYPAPTGIRVFPGVGLLAWCFLYGSMAQARRYTVTALGTLPDGYSGAGYVSGINSAGQVAGYSGAASGELHATLWNGTTAADLGTLGGTNSQADAINATGQAVGTSNIVGDAATHAVLWNGTSVTDLGTLGGKNSYALGINTLAQIVGYSDTATGGDDATLWADGKIIDLNSVLTGALGANVSLTEAVAINDSGWIIADGTNGLTNYSYAYLLKPVPLPAAAWLLVSGLAGLGALARKRRCWENA